MNRRTFLQSVAAVGAGCLFPAPYRRLAAAVKGKIKITGVKCMIVRGTWDWNLIKIETDSVLYGIGEAWLQKSAPQSPPEFMQVGTRTRNSGARPGERSGRSPQTQAAHRGRS